MAEPGIAGEAGLSAVPRRKNLDRIMTFPGVIHISTRTGDHAEEWATHGSAVSVGHDLREEGIHEIRLQVAFRTSELA
jgi:hypothetical protein